MKKWPFRGGGEGAGGDSKLSIMEQSLAFFYTLYISLIHRILWWTFNNKYTPRLTNIIILIIWTITVMNNFCLSLSSSQPESEVYCYTIINCICFFPLFIFRSFHGYFVRRSSYLFRNNVSQSIPSCPRVALICLFVY